MAETHQRLMFRYLQLKQRARRNESSNAEQQDAELPPLHDLVNTAWERLDTVGKRHVPALPSDGKPVVGTRYVVPIRRRTHEGTGAVLLRLCVYTGGESAGFAPKDLEASEAQMNYHKVVDDDGEPRALGVEFSALLLGRTMLIQNRAGAAAARSLRQVIRSLGRAACGKSFVLPDFMAVSPTDIRDRIKEAGGVAAVSFGVLQAVQESGASLNLIALRARLGAETSRVRLGVIGDHTLDADASMELYEDHHEEGLENVRLHLKDETTISAEEATLSRLAKVPLTNGVPDCDAVDRELIGYLCALMEVSDDGGQSIGRDGIIGDRLRLMRAGPVD